MSRLVATLACLAALSAHAGNRALGVIVAPSATSKNNTSTAAAFSLAGHQSVELQCDIAVCVVDGVDSTATASCATHLIYAAGTIIPVSLTMTTPHVAVIPVAAATATCRVVTAVNKT